MNQGVIEMKYNAVNRPYFVLKDHIGNTIIVSESYSDRISCERSIIDIRENIAIAQLNAKGDDASNPRLEMIEHSSDKFQFCLYSLQGEIILTSESYCDKESCINQMKAFKEYCANAKILDLL